MAQHALDSEMGFAGIGWAENRRYLARMMLALAEMMGLELVHWAIDRWLSVLLLADSNVVLSYAYHATLKERAAFIILEQKWTETETNH